MKINSIQLKNIHSLKGTHAVNFIEGPLAQTGLFAIIGPTGSGKSTLLDAITLALFNATPRSGGLSNTVIDKMGAVITRNTDEAFCEVEYESAGKVFRSRWEISRARTGKLREYHMSLAIKSDIGDFTFLDLKRSEIPAKNAEIIGLNYDQFVKSILLSQGEFAKFLKSDAKERSLLLEKITGTEIYREIGKAAFEKQKEEKQNLEKLSEKFGDINLFSDEEVNSLKAEIFVINEKIETGRAQLKDIIKKIEVKKQITEKVTLQIRLKEQMELLSEKQKKLAPDIEKLALHNKLLPLKSNIDRLAFLENNGIKINHELKQSAQQSGMLSEEINALELDFEAQTNGLALARKNHEVMLPVFAEAKKIDQQIKIEHLRHAQILQLKNQNLRELQAVNSSIEERMKNLEKIKGDILRIDQFLEENPELEQLGDVLPEATGRKTIYNEQSEQFQKLLKGNHPTLSEAMSEVKALDEKLGILQNEKGRMLDEKHAFLAEFDDELPNPQIILDQINSVTHGIQLFNQLLKALKLADDFKNEKLKTNAVLDRHKMAFDELKQNHHITEQSLEIAAKRIEELRIRKEREALEAKYDQAREMLEPGTPCPLCGSTLHPFVENYESRLSETSGKLAEEKKRFDIQKISVEKTSAEMNQLHIKISNLESGLARLENDLATINAEIEALLNASGMAMRDANLADVSDALKKSEQKQVQLKIQLGNLAKLDQLDKNLSAIAGLHEKLKELMQLDDGIHKSLEHFVKYFGDQAGADEKIKILQTKLSHFKEAHKRKAQYREDEAKISSALSENEKQKAELEKQQKQLDQQLTLQEEMIDMQAKKRFTLFRDKDPEEEENASIAIIQNLEKEISEIEKMLLLKKEQVINLENQMAKLKIQRDESAAESNHLQTRLSAKLRVLGLQSCNDALQAMLNEEEASAIYEKQTSLNSAIDKATQSIDDLDKNLLELKAKDDPEIHVEDLDNEKITLESAVSSHNREIGNLTAKLQQDVENRNKSAGILKEIQKQEKEFSRWEALNKLIGDAKGDKFAKFAQQLTLARMLAGANHHLKKLTDRYIVIIDASGENDELFVVDTYYGDERRSVKTLSGGESFLVSLALALGLSDLAASKTKINSLFIDEGFGSLDQQTLDTALSTLEKLQHETNRTIGVISHVEALKERITTQIELSQDATGNSSLKIIS